MVSRKPIGDELNFVPAITLLDSELNCTYSYDIQYSGLDHEGKTILGYFPRVAYSGWLVIKVDGSRLRDRVDVAEYFSELKQDPFTALAGNFTMRRIGISPDTAVLLNTFSYDLEPLTGSYNIAIGNPQDGAVSVKLCGDHDELGAVPQWDWGNDGVFDAEGASAELPLGKARIHPFQALVQDINGTHFLLQRTFFSSTDKLLGYITDGSATVSEPIVAASLEPPASEAKVAQFSRLGRTLVRTVPQLSGKATPYWFIELPEEKKLVPVSELKVSLTARPLLGSASGLPIDLYVMDVKPEDEFGEWGTSDSLFPWTLLPGGTEDELINAFEQHAKNIDGGALTYLRHKFSAPGWEDNISAFPFYYGITFEELLSKSETDAADWIGIQLNSDYRNKHWFSGPDFETNTWKVRLHDTALEGKGLVIGFRLNYYNLFLSSAYEFSSGPDVDSKIQVDFADESSLTYYMDISKVVIE